MVEVERFLSQLHGCPVVFFPVRHHSPACAYHLQQLIHHLKPRCILVEGPENFTGLIPLLVHEKLEPPVAIYTTYIDKARHLTRKITRQEADFQSGQPLRFAAYYPFSGFSPELVALKTGISVGAELRFIDLSFPDQLVHHKPPAADKDIIQMGSLLEEIHLQRSRYIQQLAQKTGCRDHDDLWDHLFEINYRDIPTREFIDRLAVYCYMARLDYSSEILETDGTLTRERTMAAHIKEELAHLEKKGVKEKILVVTGGFHTPGLLEFISSNLKPPQRLKLTEEETQSVLMRYSFDQLDALNGYSAGMPSPRYYHEIWSGIVQKESRPFYQTASRLLVEIGGLTREKQFPAALSPADEIAALEQAQGLAQLRNHPEPTREDFLDAIRSCFVKGSMDAEGIPLLKLVHEVLSGSQVGEIPPGAGVPPIVDDFRRIAGLLRLNLRTTGRHEVSLDLYRKPTHRRISRLFHTLVFLQVPFANMLSGPDFVTGIELDRFRENWYYSWSPQTDSEMIKLAVYGSTLVEAALNRLLERMNELEAQGKGRSAAETVQFLFIALRMGLHQHIEFILTGVRSSVAEDANFVSLTKALSDLLLLGQSLEPLEAHHLTELPQMIRSAYEKTCYLVEELFQCPDEQVPEAIDGLSRVCELLASPLHNDLDAVLFYESLERLLNRVGGHTAITGAAAGILYRVGRLPGDALLKRVIGILTGMKVGNKSKIGVIYGLMQTCRELTWQQQWFLKAIDELIQSWEEDEFITNLPELRLAFANLTPREADRVAEKAAKLYGKEQLGDLVTREISAEEVRVNLKVNQLVTKSLEKDGLSIWSQSAQTVPDPP